MSGKPSLELLTTLIVAALILSANLLHAQEDQDFDLLVVPAFIAAIQPSSSGASPIIPGPNNTGITLPLTASDSITVSIDATLIENLDIKGCVNVRANNVVIRNVRINCSSFYGINISSGYTGTLIEDVEIFGMLSAGILGSDFIVRRANIHDSGSDAVKPYRNAVIESSWFHRLGTIVGSHSDGVQMVSGGNVTIRGNNIDMPYDLAGFTNSQCMIIQTNNGPIDDVLIEGNWLNGGGYCVQINDQAKGYGAPTNVRIIDNKFGRDCQFGILRFRDSAPLLSGNVWRESDESIDGTDWTVCYNDLN
ncbi:MAG: right-handed parallel beta-helix repeat-containing protein [Acidiferrobacterales bacterium]|nr:right-handed parallel beta-helix repeat-containing protein [Acidiferrobacterales bacterium]